MFKPATRKAARLRMAIDGPAGSGKTFTGLGNWWNYVVPDHSLLPMSDLPAEFLHEGEPDPLPRK